MEIQMVKLMSADGPIDRVIVEDLGEILAVCRPQEYFAARLEGRAPIIIGFKRTMAIEFHVDTLEHTKHYGQYESVAAGEAGPSSQRLG